MIQTVTVNKIVFEILTKLCQLKWKRELEWKRYGNTHNNKFCCSLFKEEGKKDYGFRFIYNLKSLDAWAIHFCLETSLKYSDTHFGTRRRMYKQVIWGKSLEKEKQKIRIEHPHVNQSYIYSYDKYYIWCKMQTLLFKEYILSIYFCISLLEISIIW